MSETKSFREQMASNTFVHVAFGFLAMGAWAVFANRDHLLQQALLAGLVQGAISGTLSFIRSIRAVSSPSTTTPR